MPGNKSSSLAVCDSGLMYHFRDSGYFACIFHAEKPHPDKPEKQTWKPHPDSYLTVKIVADCPGKKNEDEAQTLSCYCVPLDGSGVLRPNKPFAVKVLSTSKHESFLYFMLEVALHQGTPATNHTVYGDNEYFNMSEGKAFLFTGRMIESDGAVGHHAPNTVLLSCPFIVKPSQNIEPVVCDNVVAVSTTTKVEYLAGRSSFTWYQKALTTVAGVFSVQYHTITNAINHSERSICGFTLEAARSGGQKGKTKEVRAQIREAKALQAAAKVMKTASNFKAESVAATGHSANNLSHPFALPYQG